MDGTHFSVLDRSRGSCTLGIRTVCKPVIELGSRELYLEVTVALTYSPHLNNIMLELFFQESQDGVPNLGDRGAQKNIHSLDRTSHTTPTNVTPGSR